MMRIETIPCLKDNYAYLVTCEKSQKACVVDVPEASPVLAAIAARPEVQLMAILSTHHHLDHVGGNAAVLAAHPEIEVYGSRYDAEKERIPGITHSLQNDSLFSVGQLQVRAMLVPGHTMGALAYLFECEGEPPALFTGDTLFIAGSGRLFEGKPKDMFDSLSRLANLPGDTRVYCGHEYTLANLEFALSLEPALAAIANAISESVRKRQSGMPTVPSTIRAERAINPFMRTAEMTIREAVGAKAGTPDDDVPRRVREAKNRLSS